MINVGSSSKRPLQHVPAAWRSLGGQGYPRAACLAVGAAGLRVPAAVWWAVAARPLLRETERKEEVKKTRKNCGLHSHRNVSGQVLVHAVVSLAALQVVALNEVLNAGLDSDRARLEPPAQLPRRLVVVCNNNEEEK